MIVLAVGGWMWKGKHDRDAERQALWDVVNRLCRAQLDNGPTLTPEQYVKGAVRCIDVADAQVGRP